MNITTILGRCGVNGCTESATTVVQRGRFKVAFCDKHKSGPVVSVAAFCRPSTGDKDGDKAIDRAVDSALIRIKPILRDIIREELKRMLEVE